MVDNPPIEELNDEDAAVYELFRFETIRAIEPELLVIVVVREPTEELKDEEAVR